jgi:hypothetical protein
LAGQHLTKNQRETLKQLVLESQLKRLTGTEAVEWIYQKSQISIGIDYYRHVKSQLSREVSKRVQSLMKDRYAYLAQYFERIDELKQYQKDLQELIRKNPDDHQLHKSCYSELHSLTLSINSLYELLPEVTTLQLQHNETYGENPQLEKGSQEEPTDDPEYQV